MDAEIFLLSSRADLVLCPVSRRLESVFFAFVKFIMCLLVPEVKAVSCTQVLHMQVLESIVKNPFFKAFRRRAKPAFGRPFQRLPKRPIRTASGCLNINFVSR